MAKSTKLQLVTSPVTLSLVLQGIMSQLNDVNIYITYKELLYVLYKLGYKLHDGLVPGILDHISDPRHLHV